MAYSISKTQDPTPDMIKAKQGVNGGWALIAVDRGADRMGAVEPEAYFSDANAAVIGFAKLIGAPIYDAIGPNAAIPVSK
ncbi:hypothetical protein [Pararhodobacter sp.]|uniref:hypothetical protein n=1 Tax=Pararhodobacter sp. TaxID=2127056 RepID=UPI002FDCB976